MPFLSTVLAQVDSSIKINPGAGVKAVQGFEVGQIISWAITVILVVAGLIFFFMLVVGGLRWILSGGDKAATESARGQITAALIGLVIVFSAWAIATLISNIFGISILELAIPSIDSITK
jgi:hypothetical protein